MNRTISIDYSSYDLHLGKDLPFKSNNLIDLCFIRFGNVLDNFTNERHIFLI